MAGIYSWINQEGQYREGRIMLACDCWLTFQRKNRLNCINLFFPSSFWHINSLCYCFYCSLLSLQNKWLLWMLKITYSVAFHSKSAFKKKKKNELWYFEHCLVEKVCLYPGWWNTKAALKLLYAGVCVRCISPHPLQSNSVVRMQIKRNPHFRGELGCVADVMLTGWYCPMTSELSFRPYLKLSCAMPQG